MNFKIQARSEDFIILYIDMINYCNEMTLKREKRCAFIGKRDKPTLYLGGKVIFYNNKLIFDEVNKSQFKETGVDFNLWQSLFKKVYENLNTSS